MSDPQDSGSNPPQRSVAIVQRYLAHYRVASIQELATRLAEHDYELRFFFSFYMGKAKPMPWQKKIWGLKRDMQMGEMTEAAVLSPSLLFHLVSFRPDVLILEDVSGLLNTTVAAVYAKLFGKPYLIWGLGRIPSKTPSWPRRVLSPLIRWIHDNAAGFICYSSFAQRVYGATGKPTFLALNASLPRPTADEVLKVTQSIRERRGAKTLRLFSIGVLKQQKRFDVLLRALAQCDEHVELDIVGDGPERANLEQLASDLGVASRVRFHGALYDRKEKEALLYAAHLGVLPGRGGLAIQEMMTYGVPVASGVADGTEQDLLTDGVTGFLLDGFPTEEDITATIRRYSAMTEDERERMSLASLDVVLNQSNNEVLASRLLDAVLQTDVQKATKSFKRAAL